MNARDYLKSMNPFFNEAHIDALLEFKRIVFPQSHGSAIVIQRVLHQETYQHPYVAMKWCGESGSRHASRLDAFELLLLAEGLTPRPFLQDTFHEHCPS